MAQLLADARGSDLIDFALVLGIKVEEFVVCDDFRDGEYHFLAGHFVTTAGKLRPGHESLHHDLVALVHCPVDGRTQLFECLHLGDAEAAAAGIGLHEAGQADVVDDLIVRHQVFTAATYHQTLADADAKTLQVLIQCELVEGHGLYEHAAGGVGETDEVEIALQDAVLAGRSVNGDVGEVGLHGATTNLEGEVFAAHGHTFAVGKFCLPFKAVQHYDEYFEFLLVHEAVDALCTAQAHLMLGTVATADDGYYFFLFHFIICARMRGI